MLNVITVNSDNEKILSITIFVIKPSKLIGEERREKEVFGSNSLTILPSTMKGFFGSLLIIKIQQGKYVCSNRRAVVFYVLK